MQGSPSGSVTVAQDAAATRPRRKLRPQLWRQLKVGTRVVSHAFDMGEEWPPEQMQRHGGSTIYAWTIKPEHKRA